MTAFRTLTGAVAVALSLVGCAGANAPPAATPAPVVAPPPPPAEGNACRGFTHTVSQADQAFYDAGQGTGDIHTPFQLRSDLPDTITWMVQVLDPPGDLKVDLLAAAAAASTYTPLFRDRILQGATPPPEYYTGKAAWDAAVAVVEADCLAAHVPGLQHFDWITGTLVPLEH